MAHPPHRVLIVDDEPHIARALGRLLRGTEFEVQSAYDGPTALEMLERFRPDAVISDLIMPGMSGGELLAMIGERAPKVARILLSGASDLASVAAEVGVSDYLPKPWSDHDLVGVLRLRMPSDQTG
jgi:CheY-like chemotaxis protein